MSRRVRTDVALCLLLMVAGLALGVSYVRITRQAHLVPDMPDFSRRVFGAAAMSICGHGLRTPDVTAHGLERARPEHRPLVEFIEQRREALACGEIPADQPAGGLDGMQRASQYLMRLVVSTWGITGLTWAGIDYLQGAMFAVSIGLTYLIGRLAMGPVAATIVTVVLLLSPIQLTNLYDLRDYAKAPFFLASILVAGLLITRRRGPRMVVAWCAAGGALLGFGFGIRTDVVINLMLIVGAAIACMPGRLVDTWRLRLAAAAACLLSFGVVAWPILTSQSSGSNLWHWALLGYAHDWDLALNIVPGPYEPMYFYSDSYVATTVDAFAGRTLGALSQVSVGVPGYAEASQAYYTTLVGTFPADAVLRGWAAVIQVLDLPFSGMHSLSAGIFPDVITRAIELVGRVRILFAGLGTALFAASVLALSVWNVRLAASLFAVVVLLGAYPAIQFQLRHIFHLELLSVWMLGFLCSAGLARIVGRWRGVPGEDKEGASGGVIWRPVGFALCVVLIVTLPMAGLRAYQQQAATTLIETYVAASREPLVLSAEPAGPGVVRLAKDALPEGPKRSMRSDMIVAEISAEGCPVNHTVMSVTYDTENPDLDFTRTYDVEVPSAGNGVARVFVPIYRSSPAGSSTDALKFGGIEIAEAEQHCLKEVSRFAEADRYPMLLPVVLAPDWRERPLHQTLRGWERNSTSLIREPETLVGPTLSRALVNERLSRGGDAMVKFVAPLAYAARIVRTAPDAGIDVDGVAEAPGSYLAAWEDSQFAESDMVLVEGELVRGGLAIGLTNSAGWAARMTIGTPGAFRAVIKAPLAGRYQLVFANHLRSTSLRNRFTISRIVILDGDR